MFSRGREKRGRDSEIVKEGGGCRGEREEERGRERAKRMKCPRFFLSSSYFLLFFFSSPFLFLSFVNFQNPTIHSLRIRSFTPRKMIKTMMRFPFFIWGNNKWTPRSKISSSIVPSAGNSWNICTNEFSNISREAGNDIFSIPPSLLPLPFFLLPLPPPIQKLRNKRTLFSLSWLDIIVQSRD